MIIDTHAHYDEKAFDSDREELLSSMSASGVKYIVNVGADPEGARASAAFAVKYDFIYAAIGIHPDHAKDLDEALAQELRQLASRPKTVAIGEIGLDYYWDASDRAVQKEMFIRQLSLAKELNLPINVHSREAAQDTFDIIQAHHAGTTGGIIHCFSGSVEMAREYVKLGYYIGVGGVVTFKNGKTLKQVVADIPIDRIVTETDCPYLAPVPFRGKRNDSRYISYVIDEIAQIRGMDREETEAILFANGKRVYGLGKSD